MKSYELIWNWIHFLSKDDLCQYISHYQFRFNVVSYELLSIDMYDNMNIYSDDPVCKFYLYTFPFWLGLSPFVIFFIILFMFCCHAVRRFKNGTPVFALFLCEILIKFDTQWPNFRKDDENMNLTSSVPFLKRRSVIVNKIN